MPTPDNDPEKLGGLSVEGTVVRGHGRWTVRWMHGLEEQLATVPWPGDRVTFDMSAVERIDTGGVWLLHRLVHQLRATGREVEISGLSDETGELLQRVADSGLTDRELPRAASAPLLAQVGGSTREAVETGVGLVAFTGAMGRIWLHQLFHPGRIRWREIMSCLGDAGHRALAIIGLLSFLLGIVIAYQGGVQLEQYGASLYVADLVGLSWTRELGPLITAIIVAGRTGSAYTAQIGTMIVTEEVDALRSLGIEPIEILVLPKLLALLIALPLLTVYSDIMGILGGMVMAGAQLQLAYSTFIDRVGEAVSLTSYLVGVGKSPVFAAIIATIGCYQGFQVSGGAESVGRHTTKSVVLAILTVIVVDAMFSIAFNYLDI